MTAFRRRCKAQPYGGAGVNFEYFTNMAFRNRTRRQALAAGGGLLLGTWLGKSIADTAQDVLTTAGQLWSLRDRTPSGKKSVADCIDLLNKYLQSSIDLDHRYDATTLLAKCYIFLSVENSDVNYSRIAVDTIYDLLVKQFSEIKPDSGVYLSRNILAQHYTDERLSKCAMAVFLWGFASLNMAEYLYSSHPADAIGLLARIRTSMQACIDVKKADIFYYSPYACLCGFYLEVPSILGGNRDTALRYGKRALEKTKIEGLSCSVNGLANYYLAETLHALDQDVSARAILNDFIEKAEIFFPRTMYPRINTGAKNVGKCVMVCRDSSIV